MEYSIGEVAEAVGLTAYTLRFYEKEGLLPPIKRNTRGIRVFSDDDIYWIDFINCMRETGMSLQEIKYIIDLSLEGDKTIPKRKQLLKKHKQKIENQIRELQRFIDKIDKKLEWYDGKKIDC